VRHSLFIWHGVLSLQLKEKETNLTCIWKFLFLGLSLFSLSISFSLTLSLFLSLSLSLSLSLFLFLFHSHFLFFSLSLIVCLYLFSVSLYLSNLKYFLSFLYLALQIALVRTTIFGNFVWNIIWKFINTSASVFIFLSLPKSFATFTKYETANLELG